MIWLAAVLSLAALDANDVQAGGSETGKPPVVVNPAWLEEPQPSYDDYPPFAWMIGIDARVDVECMSNAQGMVKDCRVTREAPAGLGFGESALAIVPRGRLSPRRVDGVATESSIGLSLPFTTTPLVRTQPKPWRGEEPTTARLAAAEAFVASMGAWPPAHIDPMLEGLAADRREVVRRWLIELLPGGEQTRKMFVRALARAVPQNVLERWINGEPSEKDLQAFSQIQAALDDQFDLNAAELELRRRYCSRYDCGESSAR